MNKIKTITICIIGISAVTILCYLGLPIFVASLMILGRAMDHYSLPKTEAVYDGMIVEVNSNKLKEIFVGNESRFPRELYVLIENNPTRIARLTSSDLNILGFKPTFSASIYDLGIQHEDYSIAKFSPSGLEGMNIGTKGIQFSASKDGPFLQIGDSFSDFEKQFGKPKSWSRPKSNPRDPR